MIFILSAIEEGNFYCSSENLLDSINHPTPFCLISGQFLSKPGSSVVALKKYHQNRIKFVFANSLGAAVHYFLVNMMFWLVCYSLSIMFKVVFPIYSKRMERQQKIIHVGVSILGKVVVSLKFIFSHLQCFACRLAGATSCRSAGFDCHRRQVHYFFFPTSVLHYKEHGAVVLLSYAGH